MFGFIIIIFKLDPGFLSAFLDNIKIFFNFFSFDFLFEGMAYVLYK